MPLLNSCCCWRTVRRGTYACAVYSLIYYSYYILVSQWDVTGEYYQDTLNFSQESDFLQSSHQNQRSPRDAKHSDRSGVYCASRNFSLQNIDALILVSPVIEGCNLSVPSIENSGALFTNMFVCSEKNINEELERLLSKSTKKVCQMLVKQIDVQKLRVKKMMKCQKNSRFKILFTDNESELNSTDTVLIIIGTPNLNNSDVSVNESSPSSFSSPVTFQFISSSRKDFCRKVYLKQRPSMHYFSASKFNKFPKNHFLDKELMCWDRLKKNSGRMKLSSQLPVWSQVLLIYFNREQKPVGGVPCLIWRCFKCLKKMKLEGENVKLFFFNIKNYEQVSRDLEHLKKYYNSSCSNSFCGSNNIPLEDEVAVKRTNYSENSVINNTSEYFLGTIQQISDSDTKVLISYENISKVCLVVSSSRERGGDNGSETVENENFCCHFSSHENFSVDFQAEETSNKSKKDRRRRSSKELPSIAFPVIHDSTVKIVLELLTLLFAVFGIPCSFLVLVALWKECRFLLLPWIANIMVFILLDFAYILYSIVYSFMRDSPKMEHQEPDAGFAMLHTFNIFNLILNIYASLCVISQYQEFKAGRGTAEYDDFQNQQSVKNNQRKTSSHATGILNREEVEIIDTTRNSKLESIRKLSQREAKGNHQPRRTVSFHRHPNDRKSSLRQNMNFKRAYSQRMRSTIETIENSVHQLSCHVENEVSSNNSTTNKTTTELYEINESNTLHSSAEEDMDVEDLASPTQPVIKKIIPIVVNNFNFRTRNKSKSLPSRFQFEEGLKVEQVSENDRSIYLKPLNCLKLHKSYSLTPHTGLEVRSYLEGYNFRKNSIIEKVDNKIYGNEGNIESVSSENSNTSTTCTFSNDNSGSSV